MHCGLKFHSLQGLQEVMLHVLHFEKNVFSENSLTNLSIPALVHSHGGSVLSERFSLTQPMQTYVHMQTVCVLYKYDLLYCCLMFLKALF